MNAKTETAVKKACFSYVRFSSAKQAKGTSEDRQLKIAPRIAAEKGWQLNDSLNLLDLGLSAYKKQNVGSLIQGNARQESPPESPLGTKASAFRLESIPSGRLTQIGNNTVESP